MPRYGWLGLRAKHKAHILDTDNHPLCGLHNSTVWGGLKRTSDELGPHKLCPNCRKLKGRKPKPSKTRYWISRSGQIRHRDTYNVVVTQREDWSDLNIYDMDVMPWSDEQVVVGRYESIEQAKTDWRLTPAKQYND